MFCSLGESHPGMIYHNVLTMDDFCGREETNTLLPYLNSSKFLTKLYEKGCQYGIITLLLNALTSLENLEEYATLSDHPLVKHFIKGPTI